MIKDPLILPHIRRIDLFRYLFCGNQARPAILGQFSLSHMGCLIEIVKISNQ